MARTRRPNLPAEKGQAIAAIRRDSSQLQKYAQYRDDEEFVLALISSGWMPCPSRGGTPEEQLREWRHFHESPQPALDWATPRFCHDETLARRVVRENWRALPFVTPIVRADRPVVLGAVRCSGGNVFEYASEELKADRTFVLEVVRSAPSIWRLVAAELTSDRDFSIAVLEATHYLALEFMSEEYKADRTIISVAVQNERGRNLRFASDHLRDDYDVVQLAVQNGGSALEYASYRLRSNREIVQQAVQSCGRALLFCTNELFLADRDIVLTAVSNWGDALIVASEDLKNDREIVQRAIQHSLSAIMYASPDMKADAELGRMAIQAWPKNYEFVTSESLKSDKDLALMALQREIDVFQYLSPDLQNDLDVVYKAVWKDYQIFRYTYWDVASNESESIAYCQTIKARIGSLARAVLSARNIDIRRNFPTFAKAWQDAIRERHTTLFRWSVGTEDDDRKALPHEVQGLILEYSSEAHYAKELLIFEPLIELFIEREYSYDHDCGWLQFLKEHAAHNNQ